MSGNHEGSYLLTVRFNEKNTVDHGTLKQPHPLETQMWNFASNHPYLFILLVLGFPVVVGFGTAWIIQSLVILKKAEPRNIFESMGALLDRAKDKEK